MRFLGLFIMIICIISAAGKRYTRKQRETNDAFWDRELTANHARKKDISTLPYITIPLEKFPIGIAENETTAGYEDTLKKLAESKILNLGSQSNTDLKLAYGPANLTELSEYDQNFATLCKTIAAYGECLLDLGYETEAQTVLEFGIECGSDISKNYLLLGKLYLKQGRPADVEHLKESAKKLDSIMRKPILDHLEKLSDTTA